MRGSGRLRLADGKVVGLELDIDVRTVLFTRQSD